MSNPAEPPLPFVSVLVPCRNERRYIENCLGSIVDNGFPSDRMEVLVLDGLSDDGTRDVIAVFAERHPHVRLVDNPQQIAPTALNIGLEAARGEVIMRMDAHNVYPRDYIETLVQKLESSGADNVGGICRTVPVDDRWVSQAIALVLAHPFGVGNAYFRIGSAEDRWVDTVPFGCYRREVFERIGRFDEQLVRNQDDEFNLRLIRSGGKILLVAGVVCDYFARDSLVKLWRMYFQYGYYKPLVARKVGGVMTVRQLIPALFVASLLLTAVGALLWPMLAWLLLADCAAYLTVNILAAIHASRRQPWLTLHVALAFAVLHFSYGIGYLLGIFQSPKSSPTNGD